jgi:protein TonB
LALAGCLLLGRHVLRPRAEVGSVELVMIPAAPAHQPPQQAAGSESVPDQPPPEDKAPEDKAPEDKGPEDKAPKDKATEDNAPVPERQVVPDQPPPPPPPDQPLPRPVVPEQPPPQAEALPDQQEVPPPPPPQATREQAPVPPPAPVTVEPPPPPKPRPIRPSRSQPVPSSPPHVSPSHAPPSHTATAEIPNRTEPAAAPPAAPGAPADLAAPPQQAARVGTDPAWLAGVGAWLMAHRSYPEMARALGRQGTVVVEITVDASGHVEAVSLVRGSGTDSLDRAAQALLRGAQLPPFPPDMKLPRQSVTVPIHYRLD